MKTTITPPFKSKIPNSTVERVTFHLYSVNKTGKKLKWEHMYLLEDLDELKKYRSKLMEENWFKRDYLPEFKIVRRTITKQIQSREIN